MTALRISLIAVAVVAISAGPALAGLMYFDFGDVVQPTGGNYNNVGYTMLPIFNAMDSTGAGTGIGLATSGFNEVGPNLNGTLTPGAPADMFDPQATRDNLFGHDTDFNAGSPRKLGVLAFTGLDASGATAYEFTFFASRMSVSDDREAQYEVLGANSGIGLLDSANNTSNVVVVSGIIPNSSGEVTVNVAKGPNNNNSSGYFYLGAMSIQTSAVPEPAGALLLLLGIVVVGACRRARASF